MKKSIQIVLLSAAALGAAVYIGRGTPEEREQRHLKRGNEYFAQDEFNKARLEYKNAARLRPLDPEIAYRWGLVDEAQGDVRSAYANFLASEQQDPHYHPALMKIAHYMLVVDQPEEAQKRIDTVLADAPNDPEAHALTAAMLLRKKDFAGAEKEARFALEKDKANITATSVLTGLYVAQRDLKRAAEALDAGIKENPRDVSLLMLKVKIHEDPLDLEKVREAYNGIFKIKPQDPQYRIYLTDTYVTARMYDEAEKALREGIEAIPESWPLKHRLISFLNQYRGYADAEKEINALMKAHPENDDLYFWLADLYLGHNDVDKAVALLEQVISRNEDDKKSLNARASLARINFVKGNREAAQNLVNAVLKQAPGNREALFIRASMEADQGRYEAAVTDLRAIIRDQPKSPQALQLLSEILLLQGYTDLAIETMNRLVDIDPGNPAVRTRLAQMYNLNGDPKRALEMLSAITSAQPGYAVAWESTARIAIGMKDYKLAQDAIGKLDAIEGEHMTATLLQGQIASSRNASSDAFDAYTKVIGADPSSPLAERALYSLVQEHHTPQELEKIVSYLHTLKTDNAYVNTILGQSYIQLGKPDLAAAAFDKAIAAHAKSGDAYIARAKLYIQDKKLEDALALLKQAEAAAPDDFRASFLRGEVTNRLGQHKEAVLIFADLLTRNPKLDLAANNMASTIADYLYTDPAMLENARQAAERFAASENPLFLDTLAWVYYRQGKYDKAAPLLARAFEIAQDAKKADRLPIVMHYHYGAALAKTGNRELARAELAKATAEGASYPDLDAAKQLLNELK